MTSRSPIVSEFESDEQARSYEQWLKEKVAASVTDPRSPLSHDEAMARVKAAIAKRRKAC